MTRVRSYGGKGFLNYQQIDHNRSYIFQGKIPGSLSSDKVSNPHGERSFSYQISDLKPIGARIIDSTASTWIYRRERR
ncbi:MAG: hypothetical protein WA364_29995 [Candidatus Nitrosopolaris sp.]